MSQERKLAPIKLDDYKTLHEIVWDSLREAIVGGILQPGSRLMEVQLAEEMGVSRTPVREAIRKLELEGFVIMVPRKGAYVATMSIKDAAELYEIRAALESLAAGLAAERITEQELEKLERLLHTIGEAIDRGDLQGATELDRDFHEVLFKASRNDRLVQMVSNLGEQIHRFRATSLSQPGRLQRVLREHRAIVEALSVRDPVLASARAHEHIENAQNNLLEVFEGGGGSTVGVAGE